MSSLSKTDTLSGSLGAGGLRRSPSASRALPDPIGSPSHRPPLNTRQPSASAVIGGGSSYQQRPHSPPHAPPGASRSRSQSFASGFRPGAGVGGGGLPSFSFTSTAGAGSGTFDDDEEEELDHRVHSHDEGKGNNHSPFARDLREILQDTAAFHEPPRRPNAVQHPHSSSRFDEFGFGRGSGQNGGGGGYGGMGINLFHAIESSSRFGVESGSAGSGYGLGGVQQGGSAGLNSGTGSRRHSVSIVPGGKNGGVVPDFRVSGSSGGGSQGAFGRNPWSSSGFSRAGGGAAAFSDEELATSLGNALSLKVQDDDLQEGGGHFHVPSSSVAAQHPSSLPIYAAPSPPRSYPSFGGAGGFSAADRTTLGVSGLSPIASRPHSGLQSYLSTSATSRAGSNSVERDYRSLASGLGAAPVERPGSKSRSASFADFTRPDHARWGPPSPGGDEDDDFASSPRGRERSFGLAPGGGGGSRDATSPARNSGDSGSPVGRPPAMGRAESQHRPRSASRTDPVASSILRSPAASAASQGLTPMTTTRGFAPPSAIGPRAGEGGGFPSFRPQQQQQHQQQQHLGRLNAFAPTAPPFIPSAGQQGKGSPFGLPTPIGAAGPSLPFDMHSPFGQPGPGRSFGGPPPQGGFNLSLSGGGGGGGGLGPDLRFGGHHLTHHLQQQQLPPAPQQQQQQQQQRQPYPNFYPQPPQYNLAHHQRQLALDSPPPVAGPSLADLGKGLPLHAVPSSTPLYIIEFKAGRTDLFYSPDRSLGLAKGDLVIVEADRGKDLGKIVNDSISIDEVKRFQERQTELALIAQQAGLGNQGGGGSGPAQGGSSGPGPDGSAPVGVPNSVTVRGLTKEIMPKRIYSKAQPLDAHLLVTKMQDEAKALVLCQQKVKQKNLPMEVVDAEFQWDRRKLTFYFIAERRIDFRELVRELFRYHKTRIWMACLGGISGEETAPSSSSGGQPQQPDQQQQTSPAQQQQQL